MAASATVTTVRAIHAELLWELTLIASELAVLDPAPLTLVQLNRKAELERRLTLLQDVESHANIHL